MTAPVRVCFITVEFHGLFKNGGIGTANTGLALTLAGAGFAVTVAFANSDANGPRIRTGDFAELKARYRSQGIVLDHVPPLPEMPGAFNDPRSASLSILAYLRRVPFDIVLFNDNGGQAYYPLLAKHAGTFPDAPRMVVVAHGPFDWVHALNSLEYWNREPVVAAYMERRCAALADRLISPSRYLIGWMRDQGWTLPDHTQVIQNLIAPVSADSRFDDALPAEPPQAPLREIVFFGRQEIRKGIALFCDAIDALRETVDISGLTITILGKFSRMGGIHSGVYIVERARHWPATLRISANASQAEAVAYLRRPGVLAVIPSLAENSPCVVLECLQLGLPFLATDSGGTGELVAPEDRAACLVAPRPAALAARLAECLGRIPGPSRLAVSQQATRAGWLALMERLMDEGTASRPPLDAAERPLVSICLTHTAGALATDAWLALIEAQSYPRLEVILVHDEAAPPPAVSAFGTIRLVTMRDPTLGGARNAAARAATGTLLLFVDDTALLLPDCVSTLVGALPRLGADIVAGLPVIDAKVNAAGPSLAAPIGGCAELGLVENCFGQGVILITAAAFRASGGYSADETVGDSATLGWVFLAEQVLAGARLGIAPEPLYRFASLQAPVLDPGAVVDRHRQILRRYQDAPLGIARRIVEVLYQIARQYGVQRELALQHVPAAARAHAERLAEVEPNGAEARRAFVAYCCERRLTALAIDFAILDGAVHLSDAVAESARVIAADALETIRNRPLDSWHELDLTEEVGLRLHPAEAMPDLALSRGPGIVATHWLGPDVTVLKAPGTCPPGTTSLRASVAFARQRGGPVQVALAVCDEWSRLILSDGVDVADGAGAWSGWVDLPPEGARVELAVTLPEALTNLGDLYLLSRRMEEETPGPEPMIAWQRVGAHLLLRNGMTPSRITRETRLVPVSFETLRAGRLLSDTSDFPYPVFVPGKQTLLHPLPGRMALVRLQAAHPVGRSGLRATVSIQNEGSHPIAFGLWLRPAAAEPLTEAELSEDVAFSGWQTVSEPWLRHHLSLRLERPAEAALDVYLATRVPGHPDVHFCHACWHELWTIRTAGP